MSKELKKGSSARATKLDRDAVRSLPPEAQKKVGVLTERAEKKWNQLDANRNG